MPSAYQRPRLAWIKRRARRLMRCYEVSRRKAIHEATVDYSHFVGAARFTLIDGGKA